MYAGFTPEEVGTMEALLLRTLRNLEEHDLDVIRSADFIVAMGPGGGAQGGRIVAFGTPEEIKANGESVTGKYL